MITLSGTFKRVNHAIKQQDRAFTACTVRLKMLWSALRTIMLK